MILDVADWRDLERKLAVVKAEPDEGLRRLAFQRWAAEWGCKDLKQAWRRLPGLAAEGGGAEEGGTTSSALQSISIVVPGYNGKATLISRNILCRSPREDRGLARLGVGGQQAGVAVPPVDVRELGRVAEGQEVEEGRRHAHIDEGQN